ncbi:hypothetical protein [Maridesulfovibrio sp.]|uniref:hypothetical protein n=1 Tax=Maridesulfovibrio sp. TaxID=2795000 RepID=UPI0029C9BC90|nr:hypothetical protein [Maridesulfovibrio sp.]
MRIGESSGFNLNVFNMKKTDEEDKEEVGSTNPQVAVQEPQGHTSSIRDMMSGNFFQHDRKQSRYIIGMMTSFKVENEFKNRIQSVVDFYQACAAAADNEGEKVAALMKGVEAVEDEAEAYAREKVSERIDHDQEEEEKEQEEKAEKKIEEKLMPDSAKKILDADPSPDELSEEIEEKVEDIIETEGEKILKGNDADEDQTVSGNVQAAEQVSTVTAASAAPQDKDKNVELTGESTQPVKGSSSAANTMPPPGTYVDEVV